MDPRAGGVALVLPRLDFRDEALALADAAAQALAAQNADLDLDHVQPTGVLGRVMELQAVPGEVG